MQFYYFYVVHGARARDPRRLRAARMKVVVLTTSYPRDANDVAGQLRRVGRPRSARAGRRGRRRLARDVPGTSASPTAAASRRTCARAPWKLALVPRVPRRVRARCAGRGARRRPRARALDPVGDRGARDREAVRAAGVGHRRRARAACAGARAPAAARCAHGDRRVDAFSPTRRASSARSASRWCRRASRSPSTSVSPPEPAARPLRRAAERGEGDPRVRRGNRGLAARDRRRRPAARPRAGGGRLRAAGASSAPTTSAPRSSASRRGARATA